MTTKKNIGRNLEPAWLASRFEVFERFCLPSMASQSKRDFRWHIYLHEHTPDDYKQRLRSSLGVCDFSTRIFFVDTLPTESIIKNYHSDRTLGASHLVTTNIDNDDALAVSFAETLHRHLDGPERFLNFEHGYQLEVLTGKLFHRRELSNPFVSRLETWSDRPNTVFQDYHTRLPRHGPFEQLRERAGLQSIHDDNVLNRLQGVRCRTREMRNFDISPPVAHGDRFVELQWERGASAARLALRKLRKL